MKHAVPQVIERGQSERQAAPRVNIDPLAQELLLEPRYGCTDRFDRVHRDPGRDFVAHENLTAPAVLVGLASRTQLTSRPDGDAELRSAPPNSRVIHSAWVCIKGNR